MRPWWVVIVALAGCRSIFGIDMPEMLATSDATPVFACTNQPTTLIYCADFEAGQFAYVGGTQVALQPATMGIVLETRAPSISPPFALWVDSNGESYKAGINAAAPKQTRVTLELDLQIAQQSAVTTTLLSFGLSDGASSTLGSLAIDQDRLLLQFHSGMPDQYNYLEVLPNVPSKWFHVRLSIETLTGRGTIELDHGVEQWLPIATSTGGNPFLLYGMPDAVVANLGYDNVLLTAP